MAPPHLIFAFFINFARFVLGSPAQEPLHIPPKSEYTRYFDIQAHRGGRGNVVESVLPSFAWGLINGATTLELDNGITKDGAVVVWHDEDIIAAKCQDTSPAYPDDPDFPYVGRYIANLTLAQLKTLDCGSKRQDEYPMQLTYPGARISTLQEVFDFVECADPSHHILWNIESKIDPEYPNRTANVHDFVQRQHAVFSASPYRHSIMYQSFDWRTLVAMKDLDPSVITSALIDDETAAVNHHSPWLAGRHIQNSESYLGSVDGQIALAAWSIKADILSPYSHIERFTGDRGMVEYVPFVTKEMVDTAHRHGLTVKPWTVNRLNLVEQLVDLGVDGIITDYPNAVRSWARHRGLSVAPKFPKRRVLTCLEKHMKI